ncbi:kinase-like domain-containing protein [Rhizophagus diaphanus]|nr:kinase-like domain-containing protein [Rhizophagus diaphanus] [Rhizophagus sp. MUCL 43196]
MVIHISDLGFCGPADKPLNSIYGNLPYIAPEVISGKETSFASDIYSIGMLMWEISSGQPPFINFENEEQEGIYIYIYTYFIYIRSYLLIRLILKAFHSKPYSFSIPYNIEDLDNKSNNNTSKSNDIFKDDSKKLSEVFENMQINSNNDNQDNYKEETI